MNTGKYLIYCLSAAILFIGMVAGFNALVDPYHLYQHTPKQGWTHFKTGRSGAHDRMTKANHIRRFQPDVILLGSSRVDWGLDEHHPALEKYGEARVNSGMGGVTMYEMFRLTQHAVATGNPRLLVIGLDVEEFNQRKAPLVFSETRIAVDEEGRRQSLATLRDLTPTLLSMDALITSLRTIKASMTNRSLSWEDLSRRGSDYREKRSPEYYAKAYPHAIQTIRRNLGSLRIQQRVIGEQMGYFQKLLELAHAEGIEVRMYIHPYHATALDRIKETNWNLFVEWKQRLVAANRQVARAANRHPFPLRDFSGYHELAKEPLPWPKHPTRPMKHYFESSHFRKPTGDRLLDNLFELRDDLGSWLEPPKTQVQ